MDMNFCRRCGGPLVQLERHVYRCANDHLIFANSSPTVGVFFLTDDGQVLLSERGIEPHKGMLDSFGGFVDEEESLEAAIERELKEELGLSAADYEPVRYLGSGVGHYPYREETIPLLSSFFWTRLHAGIRPQPADDVAAIHQIPLHEIDLSTLHDDDIRHGIVQLQHLFPQQ